MDKQLTHWSDEVSNCDIAELKGITESIDACLVRAASSFVEIGQKLNRARVLILGDLEFGKWRDERTPFTARQANNYMKVARKFNDHTLVAKTSLSVLVELSSAPPELAEKVEAKIDAGEKVKREDVQAEKKKLKDEPIHEPMTNKEFPQTEENNPFAGVVEDVQPPEAGNTLPDGDYEMIAVTEDEFDLVIHCLVARDTKESLALAERLNP